MNKEANAEGIELLNFYANDIPMDNLGALQLNCNKATSVLKSFAQSFGIQDLNAYLDLQKEIMAEVETISKLAHFFRNYQILINKK